MFFCVSLNARDIITQAFTKCKHFFIFFYILFLPCFFNFTFSKIFSVSSIDFKIPAAFVPAFRF